MHSLFKYLSLSAIMLLTACSTPDDGSYALTGLQVLDIERGTYLSEHTVIIRGDSIAGIVEDGSPETDGSQLMDMTGKYLIPGLWDMHIHLRGGDSLVASNRSFLPMFAAHGVTTVRDAGGDLTTQVLQWKKEIQNGNLTGPYIYTSGPKIDGPGARWAGSLEVLNEEDITQALDSLENLGADFVKIYESSLSGEAYLEIIKQAKERELQVTGHMPMTIFIDDAIELGLDGIEHLYYVLKGTSDREMEITRDVYNGRLGFWAAIRQLKESYNEDTARVFYKQLADAEVYVTPTLHIDDILSFIHENDHQDDPYLKFIPLDIQQTYSSRVRSAKHRDEEAIRFEAELNELFRTMINDMQEAGVRLLPGSDSGAFNSYVYPGLSLHRELQAMVNAGLSPLEAIRSSVVNGPAFFGHQGLTGSIEAGKKADLLILNSDPLKNIESTQDIHAVMARGHWVPEELIRQY